MDNKNFKLTTSKVFLIIFLFFLPLFIIILNGHLESYLKSFLIGSIFCLCFRFPFLLFTSGYLWASTISILIANFHISISSEPYIVNLVGAGGDDRAFESSALNPNTDKFITPYAQLLNFLSKPLSGIFENSFYSLLSINCLFHSLGAAAIFKIVRNLNYGNLAERFSYFSYLFFPLLAIDGLTLMRDGVISALTAILISAIIEKNFLFSFQSIVSFLSLSFLRLGSGLLFILTSLITWLVTLRKIRLNIKVLILIILCFLALIIFSDQIIEYLLYKNMFTNFFIRITMVEAISEKISDANIIKLFLLPIGIKQFALFLYFLFAPFGSPLELFKGDSYAFFASLFSIWNIFSIKLCFQDFFYQINNHKILNNRSYFRILIFFLVSVFIIANYSIQLRHKSFVIPIQIILTAHSMKRHKVFDYSLSWLLTLPYLSLLIIG